MQELPIEKSKGPWKKGKKEYTSKQAEEAATKEYIKEKKKDAETKGNPYYGEKSTFNLPLEKAKKEKKLHTPKAKRCIESVKKQGGDVNPYAVCTASIGKEEAIKKEHQKSTLNLPLEKSTYTRKTKTGKVVTVNDKRTKKPEDEILKKIKSFLPKDLKSLNSQKGSFDEMRVRNETSEKTGMKYYKINFSNYGDVSKVKNALSQAGYKIIGEQRFPDNHISFKE